jgi:hypothetical protein
MKRLSIFTITVLLACWDTAMASRPHDLGRSQRPVPPSLFEAPAAETGDLAADPARTESAATEKEPRRGFLDVLFGRGSDGEGTGPDGVRFDGRMVDAMRLAERNARSRSINRCWRFVKRALKKAELVECYPQTALAKQAAVELPERYGFERLDVDDPFEAPVGAILVYGGRGAGHVEFRSETGFVSDHASSRPSPRPLIGVFVKPVEG